MKMVLGVLQTDVLVQLGGDAEGHLITLSDVDPAKLAKGEMAEIGKVARAFCWVGDRLINGSQSHTKHQRHSSNSTKKSKSSIVSSSPSPSRRYAIESNTSNQDLSIRSDLGLPHLSSFDSPGSSSSTISLSNRHSSRPRCIHEVSSPSETQFETRRSRHYRLNKTPHRDNSHDSSVESFLLPVPLPPVRESGFIEEVDEDEEIRSFERSRDSVNNVLIFHVLKR
jgi:hypothetical protein